MTGAFRPKEVTMRIGVVRFVVTLIALTTGFVVAMMWDAGDYLAQFGARILLISFLPSCQVIFIKKGTFWDVVGIKSLLDGINTLFFASLATSLGSFEMIAVFVLSGLSCIFSAVFAWKLKGQLELSTQSA